MSLALPPEEQWTAALSIQPVWTEHLLYTWHCVGEEGRLFFGGPLSERGRQDTCTDSEGAWWTAVSAHATSSSDEGLRGP